MVTDAKLKECEVLIRFHNLSEEQRKHLFKAEDELLKAGIYFDTVAGCARRDWEFDWSLTGAQVLFKKFKEE